MAVEPVKEILATSGWVQRTSPTDGVFVLEQGTTLTTPGGTPACSASYHNERRGTISCSGTISWSALVVLELTRLTRLTSQATSLQVR